MLSSNMKNEQQTTFHTKVTSKTRGKNQAFYASSHTRLSYSIWCIAFFDRLFCNFFKSFALGIKFWMIIYKILISYSIMRNFTTSAKLLKKLQKSLPKNSYTT